MLYLEDKITLAYIIGVALGDGNLSNPNGRAVRLRITCDTKYPNLIETIKSNLKIIAPNNKVSTIKTKGNCLNISCYSNHWPEVLGWNKGSKYSQNVRVPNWIKRDKEYSKACLRGLFQTDGYLYYDSGYLMTAYTACIRSLAEDVVDMVQNLAFKPSISIMKYENKKTRYNIRVSRNSAQFIETIGLKKD